MPSHHERDYEKFARRGELDVYFGRARFNSRKQEFKADRFITCAFTFASMHDMHHESVMWLDRVLEFQHDAVRDISERIEELCINLY